MKRALALAFALLLAVATALAQDAPPELAELRRAIEERRARVEAYEREEQGIFDAIDAVDNAARALKREVTRASAAARAAAVRLATLERRRGALEAEVARTEGLLRTRAVALYKAGEAGPLALVFAPGTLRDRLTRIRALQRLFDQDGALLARALESKLAEISAAPSEPPAAAPQAVAFRALRGRLRPPVPGALLRGFGKVIDAEYRTETFQKGVDFAVEVGEPVYAIAAGRVRFADWFRGYGRMLILDHGDGYFTVTGHLDALDVTVGQEVAAGDRVGAAGETGSLSGPRLYFEIRSGADAVDPTEWLALPPGW